MKRFPVSNAKRPRIPVRVAIKRDDPVKPLASRDRVPKKPKRGR
jgi:hypothetical protein